MGSHDVRGTRAHARRGAGSSSSLRSALADDAQQQPQLRWLEGGHAAAFLQQQAVLVPAIVDAIDAL